MDIQTKNDHIDCMLCIFIQLKNTASKMILSILSNKTFPFKNFYLILIFRENLIKKKKIIDIFKIL